VHFDTNTFVSFVSLNHLFPDHSVIGFFFVGMKSLWNSMCTLAGTSPDTVKGNKLVSICIDNSMQYG
jgi:hypothetical protein